MKQIRKNMCLFMAFVLMISTLTACGKGRTGNAKTETEAASETATEKTSETVSETETASETVAETEIAVTDQIGRTVTLSKPAEKIVSAYYISTALLIALGCEDNLAGIEKKADTRELYKLAAPQLLELPAVGSGKGINVEEAALSPDLVILPAKLQDSVEAFEALDIPVLVVNPETQADFESCVSLLAEAAGKAERGDELLQYYHTKTEEMKNLTQDLERPAVYLSGGAGYLRTCTSQMYQNDLITLAGGRNVSEELTGGYWQDISPEQLVLWNPEYYFAVSYAEYTLEDIKKDTMLSETEAVKNGKVLTFPSEIEPWDYPTPSSVLGIMWLAYQPHPEVYGRETYVKEAQEFYQTYFDITVTEAQLGV